MSANPAPKPDLGILIFCVSLAFLAYVILVVICGENPLNWLVRNFSRFLA